MVRENYKPCVATLAVSSNRERGISHDTY